MFKCTYNICVSISSSTFTYTYKYPYMWHTHAYTNSNLKIVLKNISGLISSLTMKYDGQRLKL